jgi:hypothetical protein
MVVKSMNKLVWGSDDAAIWLPGIRGAKTPAWHPLRLCQKGAAPSLWTYILPVLLALACWAQPSWHRVYFFQVQSSFYKSQIMYHYAWVQY